MKSGISEAAFRCTIRIESADKLSTIKDEVRKFSKSLGYDRFVLFSVAALHDEVVQNIFWIEGDWFPGSEKIDAKHYFQRCPVTRHVFAANAPFFWTKMPGDEANSYKVVASPRGPGIHGVQIPVFGALGLEGGMSLGGETIDSSLQTRLALSLIAASAFNAARRILEGPAENPSGELSAREREVLTWIASGRQQAEIAAILGISERTVENHLRRIRKRLGVATTAQAIRVAIRNRNISV